MGIRFNTKEQRKHILKLRRILSNISKCEDCLEGDNGFWANKRDEYLNQYAIEISNMARHVFNDPLTAHLPTVILGDIRK